jgi:hypothetical protein
VVVDGVGYSSSATGSVVALDLATGSERWRATFDGNIPAPAVAGEIVYLSVADERRVVALDRATGGELWSFPVDGANKCCIAVAGGVVFVGTAAGTVYAIGGDDATLVAKALPPVSIAPTPAPMPSSSPAPTLPPLATKAGWTATSGASDFNPWGLAVAPDGRLWVLESPNDRISIFTADGKFVESWGESGSGDGQFDLTRGNGDPYGALAFAPDGSFYVLDVGNRRIQAFDAQRQFVRAWGRFGSEPGQFSDPVGMVVEANGTVDVLDDVRGVIESYDSHGKVLATLEAFPASVRPNHGANQFATGPNGHFYISMAGPNQVIEIDGDGNLIQILGAPGSGEGAFDEQPMAIGFDAEGRVYVTQGGTKTGRGLNVFAADGTYLGGFGAAGGGENELGFPWGMAVRDDGIVISDAGGAGFGWSSLLRKLEPIDFP